MRIARLIGYASACFIGIAGVATAQTANAAKNKTVTIYSGLSAGGAYTAYARLLERNMGRHLPGQPHMIVKIMEGASGRTLANWLYNVAPRDGSAFGIFHESLGVEPFINPQGLRYEDGRTFTWLGSMAKQTFVCFTWAATQLKTVDDLRAREVIMGGVGAAGAASVYPRVMNALLGTKLREIPGYGGSDVMVAIERGEVEGRCGFGWDSIKATRSDWIRDRKINVVVQFSLKRNPELADVPTMMELVDNVDDRRVLQLMFATQEMGRPFVAPPEIPTARADELKRGFAEAIADPQLLAEASKQNLEISPISGQEIDALLRDLYATPKVVAERVNAFRRPDTKAP